MSGVKEGEGEEMCYRCFFPCTTIFYWLLFLFFLVPFVLRLVVLLSVRDYLFSNLLLALDRILLLTHTPI